MLQIYIETRNIGGYTSYFESIFNICCDQVFTVVIETYGKWDSKIMSLSSIRQIRSIYYPEFVEYSVSDNFHQLRFLIRCINRAAARSFDLGINAAFDGGVIDNRSCF